MLQTLRDALTPAQQVLAKRLLDWRWDVAKKIDVPAHWVVGNETVYELVVLHSAGAWPEGHDADNLDTMTTVRGMGRQRAKQYGAEILAALRGSR